MAFRAYPRPPRPGGTKERPGASKRAPSPLPGKLPSATKKVAAKKTAAPVKRGRNLNPGTPRGRAKPKKTK